jgi:hypothetical protein
LIVVSGNFLVGSFAAFTIGMVVMWVMAMIPALGWKLGVVEHIVLLLVPGLSVDFIVQVAEAFNQAKYDNRKHRVLHALEHSGNSIVSGAFSTVLAGLFLLGCQVVFFRKFGILLIFTILYAAMFSLLFFPSVMCLIGPIGDEGDWHKYIGVHKEMKGHKRLRLETRKLGGSKPREPKVAEGRRGSDPGPVVLEVGASASGRSKQFIITLTDMHADLGNSGAGFREEDDSIVITNILRLGEGVFPEWNENNPDDRVVPGDHIVEVNGNRGTGADLLNALRSEEELQIKMLRPGEVVEATE